MKFIILFSLFYCFALSNVCVRGEDSFLAVSLIQLISSPEKYEGKTVQFFSFVYTIGSDGPTEVEGDGVAFTSSETAKYADTKNGIWLREAHEVKAVSGATCIVRGIFTAKKKGVWGLYVGELSDITRLDVAQPLPPIGAR